MRRLRDARWALLLSVCAVLGCHQREQQVADPAPEKAALQQQLAATQAELEALREEYEMFQAGLEESASELDELLTQTQEQQAELRDVSRKLEVALRLLGACRTEVDRLRKDAARGAPAK